MKLLRFSPHCWIQLAPSNDLARVVMTNFMVRRDGHVVLLVGGVSRAMNIDEVVEAQSTQLDTAGAIKRPLFARSLFEFQSHFTKSSHAVLHSVTTE